MRQSGEEFSWFRNFNALSNIEWRVNIFKYLESEISACVDVKYQNLHIDKDITITNERIAAAYVDHWFIEWTALKEPSVKATKRGGGRKWNFKA